MRLRTATLFLALCVLYVAVESECYKILAIVPTPSYSHQIPYRKLWIELTKRGHELVLVTTNPIENYDSPNLHQIDIGKAYDTMKKVNYVEMRFQGKSWLDFVQEYIFPKLAVISTEMVFNSTEMMKYYATGSNATFDLVFAEMIYWPSIYAFAHRFNAPLIGLSSLGLVAINEHALGGVVLPSHEYTWEMEARTGTNLSFFKRLWNLLIMWRYLFVSYHDLFTAQQRLAEKYLGRLPPLVDILRNTSVIFVAQSNVLTAARPKLANMLTFTSSHILDNPDPLPKDLQRFVDEAEDGFIYFSLGTNARSSDLPEDVQRMICEVFDTLPYRVVWKYEEELPNKPDNVYIAKWISQQRILGHPNVKLFIYQGGLQSSEETIHFGVPVIGFPIMADQYYQVGRMEAHGVGKRMDIVNLDKNEFESAIREIIGNKEFKERILNLRTLVRDQPRNTLQDLVWWTEYVIRTKGVPHLRSSLAWQGWAQRFDTDIVIFLTLALFITVTGTLNILTVLGKLSRKYRKSTYRKEKKQKMR